MGRLFDAVAALCGIRAEVSYEGQAAIELEAACTGGAGGAARPGEPYPIGLETRDELLVLDPREAILALAADIEAGATVGEVAARFHAGVAAAAVAACARAAGEHGVDVVVLSGGVFQNRTLLSEVAAGLEGAGLRPLVPERLPCNDGGIAYGQVAVAAARLAPTERD
jgi:hydrogenase maturation protein HypF